MWNVDNIVPGQDRVCEGTETFEKGGSRTDWIIYFSSHFSQSKEKLFEKQTNQCFRHDEGARVWRLWGVRLPAAGDRGDAAAGRHGEDRAGAGLGARHRPLQQQVGWWWWWWWWLWWPVTVLYSDRSDDDDDDDDDDDGSDRWVAPVSWT